MGVVIRWKDFSVETLDESELRGEELMGDGVSFFDTSCPVTETRCGNKSDQKVTATIAVSAGNCLDHNSDGTEHICEGGVGYVDTSCGGRNYRCGSKPTPPAVTPQSEDKCSAQQHLNCTFGCNPATGQCKQGKQNNDQCSSDAECDSLNCVAGPGGKYCMEAGTSLNSKVLEGGICGTTAYNRECASGLVCQANTCVKNSSIQIIPVGSCLVAGANCQGNQGYADTSCEGGTRCGTKSSSLTANNSVRCSASGAYLEEQINGQWQIKEMCSGYCDSATNSCQLSLSDQTMISPQQFNPAIVEGDPLALAQDPMMAATFQAERLHAIELCLQIGRTQAECEQDVQATLEKGSQTKDTCIAYELLKNPSKSVETIRAECNQARGNVVLLAGAAYGATYAPQAIQTLSSTLANPYVQTGLRAGNVALNAYQTNQACANPQTPEEKKYCTEQQAYLGLALADAAFGIPGAHGLIQTGTALGNTVRIGSALTATAEIGANVYQTGQVCLGENSNTNLCLLQASLTGLHGASVLPDVKNLVSLAPSNSAIAYEFALRDPLKDIASYTGLPVGTAPTPYKPRLGNIDELYPFQQRLISAAQTSNPAIIRTTFNEIVQEFGDQGVNVSLFKTVEDISTARGSAVTGYCSFGVCRSGMIPTEVGLLTPEGYANHYGLSLQEGYEMFAAKAGHEFGHAADALAFTPSTSERILGVGVAAQNNFGLETEARQKFFNGVLYASIDEAGLANNYFATSVGLGGNPNLWNAADQLTNQYSSYTPNMALSQSPISSVQSVADLQQQITNLGGVIASDGVLRPPNNLNRIIDRVVSGQYNIDSLRRFPEVQQALINLLEQ